MLFATALVALATVSGVFSAPVLSSKALARSHEVVQRSFEARGLLDSLRRPLPNTDPVQPPPADENSGNLADVLHRPLPPSTDPVQPPPADENSGISADILRRPLPPSTDLEERGIGKDDNHDTDADSGDDEGMIVHYSKCYRLTATKNFEKGSIKSLLTQSSGAVK